MAAPDPATLPAVIRRVRDEYAARGIATQDIGNGWCEEFASDVLAIWVGEDWIHREGDGFQTVETAQFVVREGYDATDWDWDLLSRHWSMTRPSDVEPMVLTDVATQKPTHVWITVGRRHYDAERPDGVDGFLELPFFRRWLGCGSDDVDAA